MSKATMQDIALQGQHLFIRVDFNVPLDAAQQILKEVRYPFEPSKVRPINANAGNVICGTQN